jgi:L-threonylcarbamoyladenylate synthase
MTDPAGRSDVSDPSDRSDLSEALDALRAGLVVAMPTDTVYGLAVDPRIPGATTAIFLLKGRPDSLALPMLVPDIASAMRLAGRMPPTALTFAAQCWPGPLTIVVDVLPVGHAASFDLGGDGGTVGMRCPDHPVALELLRAAGPLAVTSANRHGQPALTHAWEVREAFGDRLGAVIDDRTENRIHHGIDDTDSPGAPSTVVACGADGSWELLRPGPITERTLSELASGRSPGFETGLIGNL